MRGTGSRWLAACVLASVAGALPARPSGDPEAAARQYRVARRLAADGSPEARQALRRVIELDPDGALVDDALVEQALLDTPPRWPEGVGGLDPASATRSLALLDEAVERFPGSERLAEALYHRALLRLEPAPTHDPSAARVDLIAVATSSSDWAAAARYALAWLHERAGNDGRAFDAYQRLLVDEPGAVGARARVGSARVLLRRGRFGAAARRLQEAIDAGVPAAARAEPLRELAVRSLLREAGAGDSSRLERVRTGNRSLAGFAPTAGGGVLLGDRRRATVVELGPDGQRLGEWALPELQALVADGGGRRFAAAGSTLYRLDRGRPPAPLASLGDYAPLAALATDGAGGFWLLERRGRRIGRIDPGAGGPSALWEGQGMRLAAMAWNGVRLVAVDARSHGIVAIERSGALTTLAERAAFRVLGMDADASGRVALLDGRAAVVRFLGSDGLVEPRTFPVPEGPRALAVGLGPEGELHLFDANGDWMVFR